MAPKNTKTKNPEWSMSLPQRLGRRSSIICPKIRKTVSVTEINSAIRKLTISASMNRPPVILKTRATITLGTWIRSQAYTTLIVITMIISTPKTWARTTLNRKENHRISPSLPKRRTNRPASWEEECPRGRPMTIRKMGFSLPIRTEWDATTLRAHPSSFQSSRSTTGVWPATTRNRFLTRLKDPFPNDSIIFGLLKGANHLWNPSSIERNTCRRTLRSKRQGWRETPRINTSTKTKWFWIRVSITPSNRFSKSIPEDVTTSIRKITITLWGRRNTWGAKAR